MKWVIVLVMVWMMMQGCMAANCTESCDSGTFCCMDTCCENHTELCCPDKNHGSICCLAENTYCCAPTGVYASHCCPRWTICCNGGRYGCCDPATQKPYEANYAYALFVLQKNFAALKIDLSSGSYSQIAVNGFDDYEEVTRVFTYDETNNLFYLLQTDFIDDPQAPQHAIKLYTIDPTTGDATSQTVQGCTEPGQIDVPGFAYNTQTGLLFMSTYFFENNMTGYKFYNVDPKTAVATLQSQFINETDQYVGWFSAMSADGKTLYRLGYQDVVNQLVSGLGITDISGPTATTQWFADVPIPPKHSFYISLSLYQDSFISLAPDSLSNDLHIVQWSNGGNATVIEKFSNGHNTPTFGPIVEFVTGDQSLYSALIVQNNVVSDLDRWVVGLMSLPSGTPREISLSPILIAKLESASAFGIPASS